MNIVEFVVLAQRGTGSPVEKWFNDNPLVMGFILLIVGVALVGSGVYELRTGVTRGKYGKVIRGKIGKFTAVVRILAGLLACAYGAYTMAAGWR